MSRAETQKVSSKKILANINLHFTARFPHFICHWQCQPSPLRVMDVFLGYHKPTNLPHARDVGGQSSEGSEITLKKKWGDCINSRSYQLPIITEPLQGKFLMSHTDLGSTSEHTVAKDFSKMQSKPGNLQNLLFSCKFKGKHGKREKVSEPLQKSFSPKIVFIEVQFDPYTFKCFNKSLQKNSFL